MNIPKVFLGQTKAQIARPIANNPRNRMAHQISPNLESTRCFTAAANCDELSSLSDMVRVLLEGFASCAMIASTDRTFKHELIDHDMMASR